MHDTQYTVICLILRTLFSCTLYKYYPVSIQAALMLPTARSTAPPFFFSIHTQPGLCNLYPGEHVIGSISLLQTGGCVEFEVILSRPPAQQPEGELQRAENSTTSDEIQIRDHLRACQVIAVLSDPLNSVTQALLILCVEYLTPAL